MRRALLPQAKIQGKTPNIATESMNIGLEAGLRGLAVDEDDVGGLG